MTPHPNDIKAIDDTMLALVGGADKATKGLRKEKFWVRANDVLQIGCLRMIAIVRKAFCSMCAVFRVLYVCNLYAPNQNFDLDLLGEKPDAADIRLGYHEQPLLQGWRLLDKGAQKINIVLDSCH